MARGEEEQRGVGWLAEHREVLVRVPFDRGGNRAREQKWLGGASASNSKMPVLLL